MNERIEQMAICDEALRLYIHNTFLDEIIAVVFPNEPQDSSYFKEKMNTLSNFPSTFISNLDMGPRKRLYAAAIEKYWDEATKRVTR
jgi:hypothetical protein